MLKKKIVQSGKPIPDSPGVILARMAKNFQAVHQFVTDLEQLENRGILNFKELEIEMKYKLQDRLNGLYSRDYNRAMAVNGKATDFHAKEIAVIKGLLLAMQCAKVLKGVGLKEPALQLEAVLRTVHPDVLSAQNIHPYERPTHSKKRTDRSCEQSTAR